MTNDEMMPITSRAQLLFGKIVASANPEKIIEQMVTNREPEAEYLDFKTEGGEGDRRSNWSQALSGFANTEGGVIVWGIDARKTTINGSSVDAACECKPLTKPNDLAQQLKDWQAVATVDPVRGVEIRVVQREDGTGYVVCLIPQGTQPPYRAELEKARQYWQRIGDKFLMIPHGVLRSMFYPRLVPHLNVQARWAVTSEAKVSVVATNVGNISLNDLAYRLKYDAGLIVEADPLIHRVRRRGTFVVSDLHYHGAKCIHPGIEFGLWKFEVPKATAEDRAFLRFAIYIRDQLPQYFQLDMPAVVPGPFSDPGQIHLAKQVGEEEFLA